MGHMVPVVVTSTPTSASGCGGATELRGHEKSRPEAALSTAIWEGELLAQSVADVGEGVVHLLAQHAQDDDDDDGDKNQDQRVFDHPLSLLVPPELRQELPEPEVEAGWHKFASPPLRRNHGPPRESLRGGYLFMTMAVTRPNTVAAMPRLGNERSNPDARM